MTAAGQQLPGLVLAQHQNRLTVGVVELHDDHLSPQHRYNVPAVSSLAQSGVSCITEASAVCAVAVLGVVVLISPVPTLHRGRSVFSGGKLAAGPVDLLASGIAQGGRHPGVVEPVDELLHHLG